MPHSPRTATLAFTCALLTVTVAGCTDSATPSSGASASPTPQQVTGRKICGGLLGETGGAVLEQLLHSDTFTERRETVKIDSAVEAAHILTRAAKPGASLNLCLAYATDGNQHHYMQIEANWYGLKKVDLDGPVSENTSVFNLTGIKKQSYAGQYAFAEDKWSVVTFRCPVGIGRPKGNVVQVVTTTGKEPASLDPNEQRERLTRTGAAAAARLASALGCLNESGLPDPVGELAAVPQT
jgi:hypothetical protein